MNSSLVIMAAGLGSRYGGCKQIDGVGPHGETLMEYAIYDAVQAGFRRIVFIIKPDMEPLIERLCGGCLARKTARDGRPLEVAYAIQDFTSLPDFYTPPPGRTRPFGTVHALLCAREAVPGPFCAINADDYYGPGAFQVMYRELQRLPPAGQAAMTGYLLKNTASLHGTVTRGICTLREGFLESVQETRNIQLYPDGSLRDLESDRPLDPESVVSMNFWGFQPSIFPVLQADFQQFLRNPGDLGECLLPDMVDRQLRAGTLRVSVLPSREQWFGMTYQEDRPAASAALAALHRQGVYPESLRD